MVSFDTDFDATRRNAIIARRATFLSRAAGITYTTAHIDELRLLLLDAIELLVDDSQFTADDREYSRSLNVDGLPNAPEYRHEFLMGEDADYHAAWAYDHAPPEGFAADADAEPLLMTSVLRGRANHIYREADPGIVDRSLLRRGYRDPEEGETMPPPVVGRYAPKKTLVLSSIVNTSYVPEMAIA